MRTEAGTRQIRAGIIGAGWIATERNVPSFKRVRRVQLTAVLDRDPGKAGLAARQFRIPNSFANLDDFLAAPLDIVSLCTPPQTHAPIIEAAIRAGKHVFVEKPMTLTSGEGRALEALARERGVLLCPAHNFLFSSSVRKADSLLQKGNVGEVQWAMGIQLSSWRRRLPSWYDELPGGLFFDEAPHFLSLMRHFLGEVQVRNAWRSGAGQNTHPGSERIEARLEGKRGTGYLTMWNGAPFSEWLFVLGCSKAVLVLDLYRDLIINLPPERAHGTRDVLEFSARGTFRFWEGIARSAIRATRGRFLFGHDVLVRQFVDAVIENKPSPVSAAEGWQVVALMEKILERGSSSPRSE